MSFFDEIKSQFGKVINILQSDNAKEFIFIFFFPFKLKGHFASIHLPPHTTAKRKSRHLPKTTHTL